MTVATVMDALREKGMETLHSIAASANVEEAVEQMAANEIGALVVSTEDALVGGIFTERDVMMRVVRAGLDPKRTPLSLVMTRDVHFVSPGTTLEAALALMYVHRHRHLLVIDGPHVHGLVSMRDLAYQLILHGEGRFEAAVRLAGGPGT
ncbi:MAG TPA: CBS domain-containing protein [Usitatibacteraceae bacterium]|nr:CBS domain-containing protein [Usitatibacteraceae bacterium]